MSGNLSIYSLQPNSRQKPFILLINKDYASKDYASKVYNYSTEKMDDMSNVSF